MDSLRKLETRLDIIFVKDAPALPSNAKRAIVAYLPYINMVLGIFTLLIAWGLYQAAHTANQLIGSTSGTLNVYGAQVTVSHLTFTVWLALVVLVIEALIFIAAFPATKARRKAGWDLLFYAFLINVAYGIVAAFTDYGGIGRLLSSLIGSGVGLYLLFQIRDQYRAGPAIRRSRAAKPGKTKKTKK